MESNHHIFHSFGLLCTIMPFYGTLDESYTIFTKLSSKTRDVIHKYENAILNSNKKRSLCIMAPTERRKKVEGLIKDDSDTLVYKTSIKWFRNIYKHLNPKLFELKLKLRSTEACEIYKELILQDPDLDLKYVELGFGQNHPTQLEHGETSLECANMVYRLTNSFLIRKEQIKNGETPIELDEAIAGKTYELQDSDQLYDTLKLINYDTYSRKNYPIEYLSSILEEQSENEDLKDNLKKVGILDLTDEEQHQFLDRVTAYAVMFSPDQIMDEKFKETMSDEFREGVKRINIRTNEPQRIPDFDLCLDLAKTTFPNFKRLALHFDRQAYADEFFDKAMDFGTIDTIDVLIDKETRGMRFAISNKTLWLIHGDKKRFFTVDKMVFNCQKSTENFMQDGFLWVSAHYLGMHAKNITPIKNDELGVGDMEITGFLRKTRYFVLRAEWIDYLNITSAQCMLPAFHPNKKILANFTDRVSDAEKTIIPYMKEALKKKLDIELRPTYTTHFRIGQEGRRKKLLEQTIKELEELGINNIRNRHTSYIYDRGSGY